MRARLAAIATGSIALAGCALMTPLDDLRGADATPPADASPDVVAEAGVDAAVADVASEVAPEAGGLNPIANWTFDEGTGTTAHDVSGHGHDGVISGGSWVTGHSGTALLLNGTSQFVAVPASTDFDKKKGGSFSITAWVERVGTFSHDMVLSISYGPSDATYALEAQGDTLMNYWDGVTHVGTSTAPFVANEWHHAAVVIDTGILAHVYFDGAQIGSGAADDTARTCTAVLIGSSNYGDFFPGALDDVRFYDRALTSTEIQADMNQ
jgi:hypothetical protein